MDLYFLRERQRRLSLRFLSWFVLHQNIQTDTHDSIEDARSALMLYTAYQDFEDQGILDEKLDELYREGRKQVGSHSHRSCSYYSHPTELETASTSQGGVHITHCASAFSSCITTERPSDHAQQRDTHPGPFCPKWFPGWCLCGISAKSFVESQSLALRMSD